MAMKETVLPDTMTAPETGEDPDAQRAAVRGGL